LPFTQKIQVITKNYEKAISVPSEFVADVLLILNAMS